MSEQQQPFEDRHDKLIGFAVVSFGLLCLVGFVLALLVALPSFNRWQSRNNQAQHRSQTLKNEQNQVTVNEIRIRQQAQNVKIAIQQAAIRKQNAIGIREAQDEIAKTLTPLYVQEDEIEALKAIATSGRNATVIYVPIGSDGKPIVGQTAPVTKPTTP